jgi:DeoR/GlpR family transcriptional regulator of sugar metabolism
VSEDDTIYIDSGSTCTVFAGKLLDMNLRVVTNSLDVMQTVADAPGISLISIGGSYRKEASSFIGPIAMQTLKSLQISTCFIGTTGLSPAGVFSSQNVLEADLKARVLSISKRRVVLADAGKFAKDAFAVFARPGGVDVLVTDRWVDGMKELKELGIEVIVAGE